MFLREILRRFIGIHDCNLDTEQATGKRIAFGPPTASPRLLSFREVEESLDFSLHAGESRDVSTSPDMTIGLLFPVEIIRFFALHDDAIRG